MTPTPDLDDLISSVGDRCPSGTELDRLRTASELAAEVRALGEDLVTRYVDEAREAGASWAEIGEVLGVSRQGAHQRLSSREPEQARAMLHQRFTPRAVQAITGAIEEAKALGHPNVGTEHVLLGVLGVPGNVGLQAIEAHGIAAADVRAELEHRLPPAAPPGTEPHGGRHRPFTPEARRLYDLAIGEALALGHNYVGCEHVVVALAAADGIPKDALDELGLDAERLRDAVIRILESR
jgi:hypothetical protein